MKGKIFSESANIYQDQAKILFNYYQQVAERIVEEEERIEKEISVLEEEHQVVERDIATAKLWKWILCILIIPFIIFQLKENKLKKQLLVINARIVEFQTLHKEIFRDYKVTKLGVAYVPIAEQIKYENKSFIVDHTGMVDQSEVKLQLSKQNELLIDNIAQLEKLTAEAPLVETSNDTEEINTQQYSRSMQQINQHDYFGKLDRTLRTISFCMDDLDITSVSLPLVTSNSSFLKFIKEYATFEIPKGIPLFEIFDTKKNNNDIAKFEKLNKLKDSLSRDTAKFEDVLKNLMITMANSVQAISALKIASSNKIVLDSNKILYKILKSPYNHYSPVLEAMEIERIRNESFNYGEAVQDYIPFQLRPSSRVKYDLLSDTWVAEDGSNTNFPFGVHQIIEEIVSPMVQNLMQETRIERLKIYNHIKDQKISYLNKWHQDTEDFYGRNRAESADLINLMRESLRDYVAAYNTMMSLKNTEGSMKNSGGSLDSTIVSANNNSVEVFAAFEAQSKDFHNVQMEFENYMDRLKEDIDQKAEKFEHIDYYDALLRDGNSRDTAVAANTLHELEERRKPLISVNPLFAKVSVMPPVPNIESLTFEHVSINLPRIAKNTLKELNKELNPNSDIEEEENEIVGNMETKKIIFKHDNDKINSDIDKSIKTEKTTENLHTEMDSIDSDNSTESLNSKIEDDEIINKDVLQPDENKDTFKNIITKLYCPSCNNSVNADDIFCENCGNKLKN